MCEFLIQIMDSYEFIQNSIGSQEQLKNFFFLQLKK